MEAKSSHSFQKEAVLNVAGWPRPLEEFKVPLDLVTAWRSLVTLGEQTQWSRQESTRCKKVEVTTISNSW